MSYAKPAVFIIEDEVPQRKGMEVELKHRGFQVSCAKSIADGRKILKERGEKFDVFLIDMRLDHYADYDVNKNVTGADLIIEFFSDKLRNKNFQKPEPIILSAFGDVDFYQKAFSLGAAAYLDKALFPSEMVIRHLRALAIKRILSNNVGLADTIERIVLKSRNEADLYENLCSDILGKVLSNCLGTSFVIFLTEFNKTIFLSARNCANGKNDLPIGEDPVYREILSLMYRFSDTSAPSIIDEDTFKLLKRHGSKLSEAQIAGIKGAAFISLPLSGNFQLSIGILKDNTKYSEPPHEMAQLLISYVNPAAIMFLSEITSRWHKTVTERDTTIKKLATFCNNVGSEQLYILENANLVSKDSKEYLNSEVYRQIKELAEDLHQTGKLLEPISERSSTAENLPHLLMGDLISEAWRELKEESDTSNKNAFDDINFSLKGNCEARGERDELMLVAFRLLHWLSRRRFDIPKDAEYAIQVTCSENENEAVIVFEDNSYRIPGELREKLFNPFSPATPPPTINEINERYKPGLYLALYLSQIIVEEKYRGKLRECSDELDGELGHKIEIRIPLSR